MSEPFRELRLTLGEAGERLDKALAAAVPEGLALSRSRLQALILEGAVAATDGTTLADPRLRLAPGTEIVVTLPAPSPIDAAPEAIPLEIVHEDDDLIVLDKPAGLVVHPAPGAPAGTLVNALLHHCGGSLSGIGGRLRPGIVHRIDKDTSGLLVVAKSDAAHQGLASQFAAHDLERRYLAVTHGAPDPAEPRLAHLRGISWEPGGVLRVEGNIGRHPGDRKRMAVLADTGKAAVTRARVLERYAADGGAALVECRLETGRTHQIRVHLTFAGHPLVGDTVYGRRRGTGLLAGFPRQALHAASLGFRHPGSGQAMRFELPLPADMAGLIANLRRNDGTEALDERRSSYTASRTIGQGRDRAPKKEGCLAYEKLPAPSPEQGLSRYMQEIRKFPLLEPEEEYMLAKAWVDHGDKEAAHRLVTSHLRLAAKIAMGYRGYGLPTGEVISEANVGLMQAVKRFDPEKGFRLATYAMWWIRASIQEYILRSWSLVKMGTTAAQKKLFFNLRKAKNKIGAIEEGELRPENVRKIAEELNVTEGEVVSMNRRMAGGDASLNAQVRGDGDGTAEWQDWLEDEDADQASAFAERDELENRQEMLLEAMKALNERERHILTERRLKDDPVTLEELSQEYGVSRERIRQIEVRAFEKIQKKMRELAAERGMVPAVN